jgi:hypothetical protein
MTNAAVVVVRGALHLFGGDDTRDRQSYLNRQWIVTKDVIPFQESFMQVLMV